MLCKYKDYALRPMHLLQTSRETGVDQIMDSRGLRGLRDLGGEVGRALLTHLGIPADTPNFSRHEMMG